jgi:murein L,D-transpeptidase YcbB/YkuD
MISLQRRGRARRSLLAGAMLALALCGGLAGCERSRPAPEAAQVVTLTKAQAGVALKALAEAPSQGFPAGAFPTDGLEDALRSAGPGERAAAQRRLAALLVAYARAMHGLAIPKAALDKSWGLRASHAAYDAAADLRQAIAENRFEAWLAALPPADPQYEALRRGYLAHLKLAEAGGWGTVPDGPALQAGDRGERVAALRRRLGFEDTMVGSESAEAPYDAALAAAVVRFQHRHGLRETGVADQPTIAALNVSALARAAQIRANLERLRWLPREVPATRIDVNSAAGTFQMYEAGQPSLAMLVAAGKPGDETPVLVSKIHTVVLNPAWRVPPEIAADELEPKGEAYLAAHNFEYDGDRLVQQPGPGNSLGRVKFLFDNPYQVYLHDTPAKAAFAQPQRQVSHGCVRLERAIDLAKYLLGREAGWPPERVDEVLAGEATRSVALKAPIPVRIMYATAFVEGDQIAFRDDAYGWDAATLRDLDAALARRA